MRCVEKAEFRTYTLNGVRVQATRPRPSSRKDKKYEQTVRYNGRERVIHWGDPDMRIRRSNDAARANFNARHNCDKKKDPLSPGFWSCIGWREKASDGLRMMFLISTNAYQDREGDIISTKALRHYVDNFEPNELRFWHSRGAIGEIVEARMTGPFLVEVAKELPGTYDIRHRRDPRKHPVLVSRKATWDLIEKSSDAIAWGASPGFTHPMIDRLDGVFDHFQKYETSVLPRSAAANAVTFSQILKEITNG